MNKIMMMLLATFALLKVSRAQKAEDSRENFLIGVKFGVNHSNVYDEAGQDFVANPKTGIAAGLFSAIPVNKYFGIQPELLYSQKGFHATGYSIGGKYNYTRTSTWLDLPILLSLKPNQYVSLFIGPQYSYLLSERSVFEDNLTTRTEEKQFKNENIRKNTLCLNTGLDVTGDQIVLSLRAGWDLQTNNGDGTSTIPRYKNHWLQATLGFIFN